MSINLSWWIFFCKRKSFTTVSLVRNGVNALNSGISIKDINIQAISSYISCVPVWFDKCHRHLSIKNIAQTKRYISVAACSFCFFVFLEISFPQPFFIFLCIYPTFVIIFHWISIYSHTTFVIMIFNTKNSMTQIMCDNIGLSSRWVIVKSSLNAINALIRPEKLLSNCQSSTGLGSESVKLIIKKAVRRKIALKKLTLLIGGDEIFTEAGTRQIRWVSLHLQLLIFRSKKPTDWEKNFYPLQRQHCVCSDFEKNTGPSYGVWNDPKQSIGTV